MFARVKKAGPYEYLQIVENRWEDKKSRQRVIATVGRMDELRAKGAIETLTRSLSRFSEKALLLLSERNENLRAEAKKIGPALIFERLWKEVGMDRILHRLLAGRKFAFDVERATFLTVLHRLFPSGSDRSCDRWHRDYVIHGVDDLSLHHLYRAMAFLGKRSRIKGTAPSRRAVPRTSSKKSCSIGTRIFSALSTSSSSTPPPSTLKEREERSASSVTPRTIVPICTR